MSKMTMSDISIEQHDFGNLNPETSHVVIKVDIGKLPPDRAMLFLKRVGENLDLLKQLDSLAIPYTLAACRDGIPSQDIAVYNDNCNVVTDFNMTTVAIVDDSEPECEIKEEPKPEEPWDKPYTRAMEKFLR